MNILDSFDYASFKKMNIKELYELCNEVRELIIQTVAEKGGHLSSNLGVVELTVALHHFFDFPNDKLLFDVGHQSYTHKILTGRAKRFKESLREFNGIAGYQKMDESEFDCFEAGHSSTAISAGMGMAIARDLNNEDYNVIAFVGDGAIVSGMSLEAINHLGTINHKLIIIVNDNEMSISRPVGTIARHMSKLHRRLVAAPSKDIYKKVMYKLPFGKAVFNFSSKLKNRIKHFFLEKTLFETFNLEYLGPIDGHNISELQKTFATALKVPRSVVIHVLTKKGKGYKYAEEDIVGKWHGVSPFDIKTGEPKKKRPENMVSWSQLTSNLVHELGKTNKDIVYITPAMKNGSAMNQIFEDYPDRAFDVGIAEEHAITLAAGLALNKKIPSVAIYSTFLQRAYDQINHDISRMNLHAVFTINRSGIVGSDGETHQGIFDVGILKGLPNAVIAMPKDANDACMLYKTAFKHHAPFFIRIPRADIINEYDLSKISDDRVGKWDVINNDGAKINLIITGPYFNKVKDLIDKENLKVNLFFARYYKPLDKDVLNSLLENRLKTIIVDLFADESGLYESICRFYAKKDEKITLIPFTLPNAFIPCGKIEDLLAYYKRDDSSLLKLIRSLLNE